MDRPDSTYIIVIYKLFRKWVKCSSVFSQAFILTSAKQRWVSFSLSIGKYMGYGLTYSIFATGISSIPNTSDELAGLVFPILSLSNEIAIEILPKSVKNQSEIPSKSPSESQSESP